MDKLALLKELETLQAIKCERSLKAFTLATWEIIEPGVSLQWNWHLDTLCAYLEAVDKGDIKRLIINQPPGSMKSLLVSVFFPAWVWIRHPHKRFLTVTNEQGLAVRDALKMKWIIESDWFQYRWPTKLKDDQNEKTLFLNDKLGHRQSQGISANITGKRGDILCLDDLHDATTAQSDVIRASVIEAYDSKLSSRLNSPAESAIVLIMQRLHSDDITGHLLRKAKTKWTHLVIPMRYEGKPTYDAGKDLGRPELNDPRKKKGELLWPERFPNDVVEALEEDLGTYGSAGQMQQRPSPKGGGIIKAHWWRIWPEDKPMPPIHHQFLSYDTAFSEKDMVNAAYSAMTRWGVFYHEQLQRNCLIVLGCWYDRAGYDELRKLAKQWDAKYNPDTHLIERKATGITLIQDLKRAVPAHIKAYTPGKGEDKISRAYSVSPMFESGQVFAPNRKWAMNNQKTGLIDFVASFPTGSPPSADLTDTVTQACIFLRNSWYVTHPDDPDIEITKIEREAAYG